MDRVNWDVEHKKYSGGAKVSVWWDLGDGDIYKDCDPVEIDRIEHNVYSKLREIECYGRPPIFCYAEIFEIPYSVKIALRFVESHIILYAKGSAPAKMIVNLMKWVKDNPPPATLVFVLGDVKFSYVTNYLLMSGYTIIVGNNFLATGPPLSNIAAPCKIVSPQPPQLSTGESSSNEDMKVDVEADVQTKVGSVTDSDAEDKKYSGAAKVSVWWDLKNADIYKDSSLLVFRVYSKLREINCYGHPSIFCYCYGNGIAPKIPYSLLSSLLFLECHIKHHTEGMEDTTFAKIAVDMLMWAKNNPPPATLLLILDHDEQISFVTDYLLTRGYKIIVHNL